MPKFIGGLFLGFLFGAFVMFDYQKNLTIETQDTVSPITSNLNIDTDISRVNLLESIAKEMSYLSEMLSKTTQEDWKLAINNASCSLSDVGGAIANSEQSIEELKAALECATKLRSKLSNS